MKILFITDNYYPEVNAPAKRTHEHVIEWNKTGNDITVITGVPNFPKGKTFKGYKNKIFQTENIEGINVFRVWTFISANKGFFLRIIDYVSFMVSSFICGLVTKKHDIVIATSPQFFTAISGWLISFFKRTPFILEIRDLWPESIVAVGAMKNNIIIKLLYQIAHFLYRRADVIVCVTNSFKDDLIAKNIDANKIVVVENGIKIEKLIKPNKTVEQVAIEYELDKNDFIISFIGTIGMAHGLDIIINAAKKINDKAIKFFIMGDGAQKENLEEKIKINRLENVKIVSSKSWQEIININQIISVNLIHLMKSDEFKKVIPSKIFDSMAMKKPIILGVDGESKNLLNKSKSGLSIIPENEDSLIESIQILKNDKDLLSLFGKNGYNFVINRYNRSKLAHKMLKFISKKI